jgi:hypothetical protein
MAIQLSGKLNFVKYQPAGSNYSMSVQAGNCGRWKHCDSTELDGLTNEGRQKRPGLHIPGE